MPDSETATAPETPRGYWAADVATLGDRIAAAREATGMTEKQFARRLGVKTRTVQDWEEDRSEPRANRLSMMAGMLGVSVIWLLTGQGDGLADPESASTRPLAQAQAELAALRVAAVALQGRIDRVETLLAAAMEPVA